MPSCRRPLGCESARRLAAPSSCNSGVLLVGALLGLQFGIGGRAGGGFAGLAPGLPALPARRRARGSTGGR